MTSPGWYSDPQDPQWQQFHDGQRWTGERRPADPFVGYQPQYSAGEFPPQPVYQHGAPPAQPAYPAAQQGYPAQQPYAQQQPYSPPEQPYPQQPYPQQPYTQQPYASGGYPTAGGWAPPPRRSRLKVPLIVGAVVVLVAGLLTGGYFVFLRGGSPKFTYNGKAIDQPDQALQRAESTVAATVKSRHGVQGKDLRCYYAVPTHPAKGTKKSDVDQTIWCGPVLFVDGNQDKEYLRFTVASAAAKGDKVTLTPAAQPIDPDPAARPGEFTFKRPDGAAPPSGAGGLTVPQPPPAAKDVMTAVSDLGTQTVPAAPSGAVIGSINGGIRLRKAGPITRYGSGDDARTAPPGEKLIAFTLGPGYDSDGDSVDLSQAAKISVDGGAGHALPSGDGDYYVIAVPTGAKSVDLVLSDAGYNQTLSLLTGKPGAKNLAVLARAHRTVAVDKTFSLPLKLSQQVVFPDGATASSETISVTASDAYLWWTPPNHPAAKPTKPGDALLYVNIGFHDPHQPSVDPYGFRPELLTFTPAGGAPVRARNVATSADKLYDVFEVPAGLTSGTLQISGSYTDKFNNSSDTYTTTVASPVSIPISFPAG